MRQIYYAASFKRAYRRYTRRNRTLRARLDNLLEEITRDPFAQRLDTHKLSGELEGLWSCTCGYDCRIIFILDREEATQQERLVFIDISTHDEVY